MENIVYRVDTARHIGTGHLMRCMAIANFLSSKGKKSTFICKGHETADFSQIEKYHHDLIVLAGSDTSVYGEHKKPPIHASWLRGSWKRDAIETRKHLERIKPRWLIMDHYSLDSCWEKIAVPQDCKLLVIDDLIDRKHIANLLIDQNYGHTKERYKHLVNQDCKLLTGHKFALIADKFRYTKSKFVKKSVSNTINLLINFGGYDHYDLVNKSITALKPLQHRFSFALNLILGNGYAFSKKLTKNLSDFTGKVEIHQYTNKVDEIMFNSDFSIGAAGGSLRERFYLGLPSLVIPIAENQVTLTNELVSEGLVWKLSKEAPLSDWTSKIMDILMDENALFANKIKIHESVDGMGLERIAYELFPNS